MEKLDLRDHFAGKAIEGILGGSIALRDWDSNNNAEKLAKTAYLIADAMIAERRKAKTEHPGERDTAVISVKGDR